MNYKIWYIAIEQHITDLSYTKITVGIENVYTRKVFIV